MAWLMEFLCGILTPGVVLLGGVYLSAKTRILRILSPKRFLRTLTDVPKDTDGSGASPFRSLTMALAGTLGVGNITGVASAILAGGAGAVFWMWAGAVCSMALKYTEVVLAVKYRRRGEGEWYGGAMYYISDGLGRRFPKKSFTRLGVVFALLCIANSLVTGNIVQSNSASAVVHVLPAAVTGAILAVLAGISALYGVNKIGGITSRLIPVLTGVYMLLSLWVIGTNLGYLPEIFGDIFRGAFSFRGAAGGAVGITAREAVRYGITRGIFSNEAGCGTSPTAHASANTKSPHHQGCYGIFEVIADTLILCTMTALVLLVADKKYGILSAATGEGGAMLTIDAFAMETGGWVYGVLAVSVVLFAYATILAQLYYGWTAVGYLTRARWARGVYLAAAVVCTFAGSVMGTELMWGLADGIVCVMTVVNVGVIAVLGKDNKKQIREKR